MAKIRKKCVIIDFDSAKEASLDAKNPMRKILHTEKLFVGKLEKKIWL